MTFDERIRNVERWSVVRGSASGGYPTFQEADRGDEVVYGTVFFSSGANIEWRNIRRTDLGNVLMTDKDGFFRAFDNYSNQVPGAMCAIPTCEQGIVNGEVVYGCYFLKNHPSLEWRDIPRQDLGNVRLDDVEGMFRAVDNYCSNQSDLFSGFPSFQQAVVNGVVVYGAYLLKTGYPATWEDIPADVYAMLSRYTFNAGITEAQRTRLLNRHALGYSTLRNCGTLTAVQRTALRRAYRKNITHGISTDPDANASAPVGGSSIDVNFDNLFPLGDDEIAQTLIHEMMHCAGFTHPTRRDPPNPTPDIPFDGGPYYSSPPLQAEICIAGNQSDRCSVTTSSTCTSLTSAASGVALPTIELIAFNPPGPDIANEHVLIRNRGGSSLQMTQWTLRDRANHVFTFPSYTLGPRESVRIWSGSGNADAHNLYWGRKQAVWNNNGDTAALRDPAGSDVSVYTYP
jgi:hypothetical protein